MGRVRRLDTTPQIEHNVIILGYQAPGRIMGDRGNRFQALLLGRRLLPKIKQECIGLLIAGKEVRHPDPLCQVRAHLVVHGQ